MGEKLKWCSRGDQCTHLDGPTLPATVEYFARSGRYLQSFCKVCKSKEARQYYEANQEAIIERVREYRAANPEKTAETARKSRENNREAKTEYARVYYVANREKCAERDRKYRAENREELAEKAKKYRVENRERIAEKDRKYHADNRERILERNRKYYIENREKYVEYAESNRDKRAEYMRTWRSENRAKCNEASRRRTALKHDLPFDFTSVDEINALAYFNSCCAVCGRSFDDCESAMDHWIALSDPREDNPGTVPTNMVPLCHGVRGCNNKKSNLDALVWLKREYGVTRALEIVERIEQYFNYVRSE